PGGAAAHRILQKGPRRTGRRPAKGRVRAAPTAREAALARRGDRRAAEGPGGVRPALPLRGDLSQGQGKGAGKNQAPDARSPERGGAGKRSPHRRREPGIPPEERSRAERKTARRNRAGARQKPQREISSGPRAGDLAGQGGV